MLCLSLTSCANLQATFSSDLKRHIDHIVIIVQENRSFDNLFQGFPGADTASYGYAHDGTKVMLQPVSLRARYDISNGYKDFISSFDGGKMDGWDLRRVPARGDGIPLAAAQYPTFGFVPSSEIKPYLYLAHSYVLADHMFQSNIDQSFAAHLYLISGQAARSVNTPTGRPWGCDSYFGSTVLTLTDRRTDGPRRFPCFDIPTLGDELTASGRTWAYYAPRIDSPQFWKRFRRSDELDFAEPGFPDVGQLWTSYDAIAHVRYGPLWSTNIEAPQTRVLSDVARGKLASVTWVVPSWRDSDHAGTQSNSGPLWVASVINAIGRSKYWNSTAIFVLWDDSGGWFDHVPPPQLDYDGLGVRIPLLVVSPYARRGYVAHQQYEFGSIVRAVEETFGLGRLASSDRRAADLWDCFDFSQPPRRFSEIPLSRRVDFSREPNSDRPPDDD